MQIYVFNKDLEPVGIVENYTSAFWINRYFTNGNCEVCVPATSENLQLFKIGYYLIRYDSDLSCKIQKIEIDTNAQSGNTLIITGIDVKSLLDQRIIWGVYEANTKTEQFLRNIVYRSTVSADQARVMATPGGWGIIGFEPGQNFPDKIQSQYSYKNVGETIREIIKARGWGYRLRFTNTLSEQNPHPGFLFGVYNGADRSETVVFSPMYENLKESKFIIDASDMGNVTLVGGQGQGVLREFAELGTSLAEAASVERHEFFTDAKDIPDTTRWEDFSTAYPGGTWENIGVSRYLYKLNMQFPILSNSQLADLQDRYPGGAVSGGFYVVNNAGIAEANTNNPAADTTIILGDALYDLSLLNRGAEKLAEHGERTSFDGVIVPDLTFKFGVDYFLGDIVSVRDEFGNNQAVRVVEVTENETATNSTFEIKFEKLEAE